MLPSEDLEYGYSWELGTHSSRVEDGRGIEEWNDGRILYTTWDITVGLRISDGNRFRISDMTIPGLYLTNITAARFPTKLHSNIWAHTVLSNNTH